MPGQERQANDTTSDRKRDKTQAPDDVHEAPESGTLREPPNTNAQAAPSKPPGDVHEAPESGTIRDSAPSTTGERKRSA